MKFKDALKEMLFPSHIKCIVCDEELPSATRNAVCGNCKLPYNDTYCSVCGRSIPAQNLLCDRCKEYSPPFTAARSSFIYRDAARTLVHKLKYGSAKYLAADMAEFMADTYFQSEFAVDIVTCVPMHKSALSKRGYNQSALLAENLARLINKPYADLLNKTVKTPTLVGLKRAERQSVVKNAFALKPDADIKGKSVLIVDDVLTTGATSGECAKALLSGGASFVYVITFASRELAPLIF